MASRKKKTTPTRASKVQAAKVMAVNSRSTVMKLP